jgi:acetyl-CoA carboxylase biotin carboxyl carrier protein
VLVALIDAGGTTLLAPAPGWFRRTVAAHHLVEEGDVIGELDVLGRIARVVAPRVRGLVRLDDTAARRPVSYGDVLMHVDAAAAIGGGIAAPAREDDASRSALGLVFRAPTSGRFYGRPAPDKPPFVVAGADLATGTTICLLEVMKTFHRVTYVGERARVTNVLVADGDDVDAGAPLLALERL